MKFVIQRVTHAEVEVERNDIDGGPVLLLKEEYGDAPDQNESEQTHRLVRGLRLMLQGIDDKGQGGNCEAQNIDIENNVERAVSESQIGHSVHRHIVKTRHEPVAVADGKGQCKSNAGKGRQDIYEGLRNLHPADGRRQEEKEKRNETAPEIAHLHGQGFCRNRACEGTRQIPGICHKYRHGKDETVYILAPSGPADGPDIEDGPDQHCKIIEIHG